MTEFPRPPKGFYWSSKDIQSSIEDVTATADKTFDQERIEALATKLGAEITYIGHLAVQTRNEHNEPYAILDDSAKVLHADYRGMPTDDLIDIVVWGEHVSSRLQIDDKWLAHMVEQSEDDEEREYYLSLVLRNQASQYIVDNFAAEELRDEFKKRRKAEFLAGNLEFEQQINGLLWRVPAPIEEILDRIGISPML